MHGEGCNSVHRWCTGWGIQGVHRVCTGKMQGVQGCAQRECRGVHEVCTEDAGSAWWGCKVCTGAARVCTGKMHGMHRDAQGMQRYTRGLHRGCRAVHGRCTVRVQSVHRGVPGSAQGLQFLHKRVQG